MWTTKFHTYTKQQANTVQQIGVKYYVRNIVARKMYNNKYTKLLVINKPINTNTQFYSLVVCSKISIWPKFFDHFW